MSPQFGRRGTSGPHDPVFTSPDDSEKWFIKLEGEIYGPYPLGKIKDLADRALIDPESSVCSTLSGLWDHAGTEPKVRHVFAARRLRRSESAHENTQGGAFHNFVILCQMHAVSLEAFEGMLHELGRSTLIMPHCWALQSSLSFTYIRNAITPLLGYNDSLVITDTDSGRISTHNIGIEREVRLKNLWQKPVMDQ